MRARHRWVLAVIAVFAIVLPSASQASGATSLDILVTNDDGWRGPGGATGQPGVYQIGFGAPSGSPVRGSDWDAVAPGLRQHHADRLRPHGRLRQPVRPHLVSYTSGCAG